MERPPDHSVRRGKSSREDQVAVVRSVAQAERPGQGELHRFRGEVYDCFTARADALFDLVDGLCTPITVGGVAYVSLAPGARRGHGAAYAAVAAGRIDTDMLRDVLAAARPDCWRPDFAVDTTVWMRSDAECSPQRGFYYHPLGADLSTRTARPDADLESPTPAARIARVRDLLQRA